MPSGTDSIRRRLTELGIASYREYLASPRWQAIRRHFYAHHAPKNPRCTACRRAGRLSLHHKTYKRLGRECMGDLMLLCDQCHKQVHAFHGQNLWANSEYLKRTRGRPPQAGTMSSRSWGPEGGERPPWE